MNAGHYFEYDQCMHGDYQEAEDWFRGVFLNKYFLPEWSYLEN